MSVLIFGGSFDPIHNGHIDIAKRVKNFLNVEKVLFLIAKKPRWKNITTDDSMRLEMLKIALQGIEWAKIDLTEFESIDEINYTYNTILKIRSEINDELYFLIGADQLNQLDKWYNIEKLAKLCRFVCVNRVDYPLNQDNIDKYQVILINEEISDMSSSSLRELRNLDCPKPVLDYIIEHDLYFTKILKSYMSKKRYLHSVSVANLCYQIALENNLNPYISYLSGLIHDIGKEVNMVKQREYMEENYNDLVNHIPHQLYYQFLSNYIAKEKLKIKNPEVLDAIIYHATGNKELSDYAMIVYASDKIEPLRGYDSSHLINKCRENYYNGFKEVLKENMLFLASKQEAYLNPLTLECINYYLGGK